MPIEQNEHGTHQKLIEHGTNDTNQKYQPLPEMITPFSIIVSQSEKKQLEEWTQKRMKTIVTTMTEQNWVSQASALHENIIGKNELIFVIETTEGEKIGFYMDKSIGKATEMIPGGTESFHFNLQSNGRLESPMKFESVKGKEKGIQMGEKKQSMLITIGDVVVMKDQKQKAKWEQSESFEYDGIRNALVGKKHDKGKATKFGIKKLSVIEMI